VDSILQKTDRAFETHLVPLVGNILNPDARASVARAINTWRTNTQNPTRNLYRRTLRYSTPENLEPGRDFPVPMYRTNPDFFSVSKMDASIANDNIGAGYDAAMSILLLRKHEGESDFLDALDALHETTHKNQHSSALGRSEDVEANQNRYVLPMIASTGKIGHGVLEEECEAWSNMIEMMMAKIGVGTHSIESVIEKLGVAPSDTKKLQPLEQILSYLQLYCAGGGRKGNTYPPDYVEAIKRNYLRMGAQLYVYDKDGFPVVYEGS
jgi:hypothetical protein